MQVLFNDTIFHNIHYGRLSATNEEVCNILITALWSLNIHVVLIIYFLHGEFLCRCIMLPSMRQSMKLSYDSPTSILQWLASGGLRYISTVVWYFFLESLCMFAQMQNFPVFKLALIFMTAFAVKWWREAAYCVSTCFLERVSHFVSF